MTVPVRAYAPGGWVAINRERVWALIDVRIDDPRLQALWDAAGEGLEEVLDVLLRDGLRALPGFAIAASNDDTVRYVVRSPAAIVVDDSEPLAADDTNAAGWLSGSIPLAAGRLTLHNDEPPESVQLPTVLGVTAASAVIVKLSPSAEPLAPPASGDASPRRPETTLVTAPDVFATPSVDPEAQPESQVADHAATYLRLLTGSTADRAALLSELNDGAESPDAEPAGTDRTAASAAADVVGQPIEPLTGPRAASAATSAWPLDEHDERPTEVHAPSVSNVIEGVPWATQQSGEPPSEAEPELDVDVPSVTVSRASLLRQLKDVPGVAPAVLAFSCPSSHLSPTYATSCRVCGTPLVEQQPVSVTRPPLGRLAVSNGSTVPLDRGVIFGRAPQTDIEDPSLRPHLVKLVESDEISRVHASVMLDGWQVLLRDLGSQNGTLLTLPGGSPEQIRPNEDYTLEPGSIFSFADVVTCRFEVVE